MLYALMNADNKRMMRVTVPNRKHPAYGGDPALSQVHLKTMRMLWRLRRCSYRNVLGKTEQR